MAPPITHVHVERIDDDLVVSWRGGDGDVAVFLSTSADDAGVDLRDADRPGHVILRDVPASPRPYVHLLSGDGPFVVAAERRVPLEGAHNFRDLGGYRGLLGSVRWGRLYRSDHLGELTDGDLEAIAGLGVQLVVDYRGPHEHEAMPSRIGLDGPIRRHDRAIGDGTVEGVSLWDAILDGSLGAFGEDDLAEFYLRTLRTSADVFGEVLTMLAEPDHVPAVFHCTAGKDRTGLTAALVLSTLGVDDAQILDDYELSNRFRSAVRLGEIRPLLAEQGIDIEGYLPLFTAPRRAMAAALAGIDQTWGSVEAYLTGPAGVAPGTLAALRDQLVDR
jgi:protein-tyrosine phosphatase